VGHRALARQRVSPRRVASRVARRVAPRDLGAGIGAGGEKLRERADFRPPARPYTDDQKAALQALLDDARSRKGGG